MRLREVGRCQLTSVFERPAGRIIRLAETSSEFYRTVDALYNGNNGIYLGQAELVARFDRMLKIF
jgi:hypothetical protein